MKTVNLIFPHQLFQNSPILEVDAPIYLIEEYLFFNQYSFHKQKIAFHRASMKQYANFLEEKKGFQVIYIEAIEPISDIRLLIPELKKQGINHINYTNPTDNWLENRIQKSCLKNEISTTIYESLLFLNSKEDLA